MVKTHPHHLCLPMPRRTPRNQTSASPLTGPRTQPRQMTTVPRPLALPRGTSTIPRLSPPPYRDSLLPIPGPSRLSMQHQSGSEQLAPLQPNLQQPFILHFSMPHTTVIQPGCPSNQRYTTQMEREDGYTIPPPVRHPPPTRICPLPHSLEESVSRLPQRAASLPPPTRLPHQVQYPPQVSPLRHAQIMARRAKMRELTTLVRELNDTLEDAGPSDGIDWEKATIGIIISLSRT